MCNAIATASESLPASTRQTAGKPFVSHLLQGLVGTLLLFSTPHDKKKPLRLVCQPVDERTSPTRTHENIPYGSKPVAYVCRECGQVWNFFGDVAAVGPCVILPPCCDPELLAKVDPPFDATAHEFAGWRASVL